MFKNFFSENRTVYEITWRNIVKLDRPHMTLGPMCFSCWLRKAANTHSEYVILIGYPRQQRLLQRTSMLRYTYIACLVSLRKDLTFLTLLWHSFIDLKNFSSLPFLLLGSTSTVRDIILQYSLVSMFLPNGLFSFLSGIFFILLRSHLKVHPVRIV